MSPLAPSPFLRLARVLAVACLCLGTPAVLDIIVETASWLAGAECCVDDCDESGRPCTQHCLHCVCGGHLNALPCPERSRGAVGLALSTEGTLAFSHPRSGHLEPPFRPPVS